MTILVDKPRAYKGKKKKYSHMVSDTSFADLHYFASMIGIKRHFFHNDHYDITEEQYEKALNAGAKTVTSKELVKRMIK